MMRINYSPVSFRADQTIKQEDVQAPVEKSIVAQTKPDTLEMPVNEQKVSDFKTRLKDVNWTKQYIPEANIIHMKERNMIDGLEYEITPSGKVTEVGCWVKPTVILEKDKDAAALFNKNDANAKGGKLKTFKEKSADFWKFMASANQLANAYVKGLFYACATGAALLGGSWVFNTLPKVFKKEGPKFTEILKHPLKNISKSGKVIAGVGALGVMCYHAVRGRLNANQRTAEIDHKLKIGHRDA